MERIKEYRQKDKTRNTIQGCRDFDPSVFYQKVQKAKDQEWLRVFSEQLRVKANSDIVV